MSGGLLGCRDCLDGYILTSGCAQGWEGLLLRHEGPDKCCLCTDPVVVPRLVLRGTPGVVEVAWLLLWVEDYIGSHHGDELEED